MVFSVLCLFLVVPPVGLHYLIVEFPGQTHYFREVLLISGCVTPIGMG